MGLTRHTSLRCPVPIQGLLVMRTSPGRSPSAPISRRKWRTVAGSVPMNDGMLPVFWARAWPRASVRTQAKSLASLDSVENEVRTIALAASSTTEIRRVHRTSRVTASKRVVITSSPAKGVRSERGLRPRNPPVRTGGGPSGGAAARSPRSIDSHEDAVAELAIEGLAEVPLALDVLDQDDFAGPDHAGLAVAGRDLHARVEVDDVLPAGRRMPVEVVGRRHLAKDDAGGGQALGQATAAAALHVLHLDVPEVRLALVVDVQVVTLHPR